MHSTDREAAIRFGEQMPASRIVINSPTTHGAIGLTTDLPPSMTLGCGSWGGNVTSDNVSPIHLMDIKRVAFETKPINTARSVKPTVQQTPNQRVKPNIGRDQIAALVDGFLKDKLKEMPVEPKPEPPKIVEAEPAPSPVKTVIHELRPQSLTESGVVFEPVPFVSEADVRDALADGRKICINAKTILTPSARDLGDEKEVFTRV
jgi:hypothetical protein